MKLISLHIENFGKLSNLSVSFTEGCNTFLHENGFGKSTLAAFIRVMLFGFEGERNHTDGTNERKRFEPWLKTGAYGGELIFSTNDRTYILKKIFGKKEKDDIVELRDYRTGLLTEGIKKNTGESSKIGEQILQIDAESFKRTVFVSQNDCSTESTDRIAAKIGSIAEDTADLSNYDEAIKTLHDLSNSLSFTRKTGEGSKLTYEISGLTHALSEREHLLAERNSLSERIQDYTIEGQKIIQQEEVLEKEQSIINLASDAKGKLGRYEEIKAREELEGKRLSDASSYFGDKIPSVDSLNGLRSLCFEYEHAGMRLEENTITSTAETEHEIATLKEEILSAEEAARNKLAKQRVFKRITLIAGITILLLAIASMCMMHFEMIGEVARDLLLWPTRGFFVLSICLMGTSVLYKEGSDNGDHDMLACKASLEELSEQLAIYNKDLDAYHKAAHELEKGFMSIGEDFPAKPEEYISNLLDRVRMIGDLQKRFDEAKADRVAFEDKLNVSRLQNVIKQADGLHSAEELSLEKERLKAQQQQISTLSRADIKKLEEIEETLTQLDEVENELMIVSEKRDKYAEKLDSIELASQYLTLAKEEFSAEYTRPMTKSFAKWYGIISGNEPVRYLIDTNAGLNIEEAGLNRAPSLFSAGYKDLFGLSMRMALIDCMYKDEKPFIIMDDPFVNLDDRRLAEAKAFLREVSKEYQVIYMTCRKECVI